MFDTVDIDHRLVMIVRCVVDQGSFSLGFFMRHMDGFSYGQPTKNIFTKSFSSIQFVLFLSFSTDCVAAMLQSISTNE